VVLVLGGILRACGLSLIRFLRYIADEILLVLGTSSSESALPRLIAKMEHLGVDRSTAGVVESLKKRIDPKLIDTVVSEAAK